jgi:hypothetical protein
MCGLDLFRKRIERHRSPHIRTFTR